jgi:hypothetical protein
MIGERLVVRRVRTRLALPLLFVGCWTLCLVWFWQLDIRTNVITGLGIALTLGIQAACLVKTKTRHRGPLAMLLNVLVASVLVFAFPVVVLTLACMSGDCL